MSIIIIYVFDINYSCLLISHFFHKRCEAVVVKVITDSADGDNSWNADVKPGSLGYLSGSSAALTDAEKKALKKCLGGSDSNDDNNVDVQNWDKGVVVETDGSAGSPYNMIGAYPHAIKVVPKETNSGYTKFSYGTYHLLWYDDAATNKEFRVANIDYNHNQISEASEAYVYTTKGTVKQMGYGTESEIGLGASTSTRIVGYFDPYTNKVFTNYDTSCENQPSSGAKNFVCVEKGDKIFVVDGCWGAGDHGSGTSNPIFGGTDVFNCGDSTEPTSNTGNLYTVTKVRGLKIVIFKVIHLISYVYLNQFLWHDDYRYTQFLLDQTLLIFLQQLLMQLQIPLSNMRLIHSSLK